MIVKSVAVADLAVVAVDSGSVDFVVPVAAPAVALAVVPGPGLGLELELASLVAAEAQGAL